MRVQVRFTGRVQGVGFRATTWEVARRAGATGWVRNEPDGSVLAEIQGSGDQVERVLADLRAQFAQYVRGCDRTPVDDQAGERAFEVRR